MESIRNLLNQVAATPAAPKLQDESLIGIAALILLFLSIASVIWPKFTSLVAMMWASFKAAVDEMLDFIDHLRARRIRSQEGSRPSPVSGAPAERLPVSRTG